MSRAQSGFSSEYGVEEATGIGGHASERVHVHHAHVPKGLTSRQIGEELQPRKSKMVCVADTMCSAKVHSSILKLL